jgi:hypothetical protein
MCFFGLGNKKDYRVENNHSQDKDHKQSNFYLRQFHRNPRFLCLKRSIAGSGRLAKIEFRAAGLLNTMGYFAKSFVCIQIGRLEDAQLHAGAVPTVSRAARPTREPVSMECGEGAAKRNDAQ